MEIRTEQRKNGVAGFFSRLGGSLYSRRDDPSHLPPTERVHAWPGAQGRW